MAQRTQRSNDDGGYHAIRGFAFQFDATILEVLAAPGAVVEVEGMQDIGIEDFHIQVKLRSQTFSISKIAKAVKQLIAQFSENTDRRYRLYCHFIDRGPGTTLQLEVEQLDEILAESADAYTDETKKLFVDRLEIKFAPDFMTQFSTVLEQLRSRYDSRTLDEAVAYHAIVNQSLITLVLSKPAGARTVTAAQLDLAVHNAERAIFQGGYQNHFGTQKYIKLLRGQIQGARSVNVVRRERLVIAELGGACDIHDVIDLAHAVSSRFYVHENSPQPYLLLRGIEGMPNFKQDLWDADVMFFDGTNFNGDRFRVEALIARPQKDRRLKLIDEARLADLLMAMRPQEVYEFYSTWPVLDPFAGSRLRRMAVDSIADVVKVMEVSSRA
jgi:hypothetical protein